MPAPAGHRAHPALASSALERRRGAGRLRRLEAPARRPSRRASPRPPAASDRMLVSVFLDGGIDALSRARAGRRPALPARCGRSWRCRRAPAPRSARTPRLRWHPAAAALATLHGEGKVTVLPGDRLRPPRPVALHLAPLLGGRRADRRRRDRLAGPLPRPRRHADNPLQGLSLDGTLSPTLATARCRSRRSTGPTLRLLGARASGATLEDRCSSASPSSATAPAPGRRRWRRPPARPRPVDAAAQASSRRSRASRSRRPVAYPTRRQLVPATSLAGARRDARRRAADPLRRDLGARATTTRTTTRPTTSPTT